MNPKIQFSEYVSELKRLGFDSEYVWNAYCSKKGYWKVSEEQARLIIIKSFKRR